MSKPALVSEKLVAALGELPIDPSYRQSVVDFFGNLQQGDYVSPDALAVQLSVPTRVCFRICEYLEGSQLVHPVYEPMCSNCHNTVGIPLESLVNYDRNNECEFCYKELNLLDDIRVVYQVI